MAGETVYNGREVLSVSNMPMKLQGVRQQLSCTAVWQHSALHVDCCGGLGKSWNWLTWHAMVP